MADGGPRGEVDEPCFKVKVQATLIHEAIATTKGEVTESNTLSGVWWFDRKLNDVGVAASLQHRTFPGHLCVM